MKITGLNEFYRMSVMHEMLLETKVNLPLEKACEYFLDMRKFGELHPVMTSVKLLESCDDFTEYEVRESVLLFGFIPMKPVYNAKVLHLEQFKHIRFTSTLKKNVFLTIDFTFQFDSTARVTNITEHLKLDSNRIIASILLPLMKRSHLEIFSKMSMMH